MTDSHHFAIVTRDESWSLRSRLVTESRLIHGSADQRGATIEARDDLDDELLALCDRESDRVRSAIAALPEGRARAVVSARSDGGVSATISLSVRDLSVVTTLPHIAADYEMLIELASVPAMSDAGYRGLPLVWRNGAGAVLMHEAAGHPAELGQPEIEWPSWLSVEAPLAMRRESFTDVPLRRMTRVAIASVAASFSPPPPPYIDILLVAGGGYEPLTDRVSLSISAATLIDGDNKSVRLRPFTIDEPRESVARSLRGSFGEVRRYPGVICSKEGQNVFVGSQAPDLVTDFR